MKRIAFIVNGLYNAAGMERVLTVRLNELCKYFDITVVTHNQGARPDHFPLDSRIERVDLVCESSDYKTDLTRYLIEKRFDISVSTGGSEFFFLHSIKDGSKKVFEFHFSFDIAKVWVSQEVKGFRRWRYIQQQTWHRVYHARKYDQIVVLCKADYEKWKRYCRHVTYIYNPLTIETDTQSDYSSKIAIAVGRLHYQKGFDYLIDAWALVAWKHPEWKLSIYGEGEERERLQKQIEDNGLSQIISLKGRSEIIQEKYLESSIFVLSSRDEAFGLVITEAEACGLPIVTFACPSAPAELINDGVNGFVIPLVGDVKSMADRICRLVEDESLRVAMGTASKELSKRYSIETITRQWVDLYRKLIS